MRLRSHAGWCAALLLLLMALAIPLVGIAEGEDDLKCATLLAFVQNTHWPEPPAGNLPLTVGVVGRPAFCQLLHASLEGKLVEGRAVRIAEIKPLADPHCCQVVYFATDKSPEIKPALQALSSAHVLTVGESDRFLEEGGAVNLYLVDGHMAFEVSLGTLDRAGIAISSKLLRFGQIRDLARGRQK